MGPYVVSNAVMSTDGLYRYALIRRWDLSKPVLLIVMLNPSTADATKDDATIRSCVRLASRLGYGGINVVNLFAFRATNPMNLPYEYAPAVGLENDAWLELMALEAAAAVAAWGAWDGGPLLRRRAQEVEELVRRHHALHVFKLTTKGRPNHPLYLPNTTRLELWLPKTETPSRRL